MNTKITLISYGKKSTKNPYQNTTLWEHQKKHYNIDIMVFYEHNATLKGTKIQQQKSQIKVRQKTAIKMTTKMNGKSLINRYLA